ncbi:MAG: quinolinate synthase [Armatimonadetes bacterium]|nr:quinolinate synthase [Armatimonadota bacterium]
MNHDTSIIEKINELKVKRGAIILAHNYQLGEVQDIADFTGDSLELSRKAAQTDAKVIVFCGVHFMAETAKILSPDKTRAFKAAHPGLPVVAYVNTSAEVKAESDICCTSANAVRVVESIDADAVLFVPDKCLGAYLASKTNKRIISYSGFCPTHHRILPEDILRSKKEYPDAVVVAHPECSMEVIALADAVESTSGMLRYVRESSAQGFIMCTERGLLHRLKIENPKKEFFNPTPLNICPNMKRITLEKALWSLEDMKYEITLPQEMIEKARKAIEGMIAL